MENKKLGFEDFIAAVDGSCQDFVDELHQDLTSKGCQIGVKSAKSGYVVSYMYHKKTLANYVFRKKGLIIRIYANHIQAYEDILNTLPEEMVKSIQDASVCKRLIDPQACNPKCAMGYDFVLRGERLKKCRNSAFMFLVCEESKPFIKTLLMEELEACGQE